MGIVVHGAAVVRVGSGAGVIMVGALDPMRIGPITRRFIIHFGDMDQPIGKQLVLGFYTLWRVESSKSVALGNDVKKRSRYLACS